MTTPTPLLFAVELHPHTPTEWTATYYPLDTTTTGSSVDITTVLHRHRLPAPPPNGASVPNHASARWLEARVADPDAPCYADYPRWRTALAAGYTASLSAHHAESTAPPLQHHAHHPSPGTILIPAGQLSEWIIRDTVTDEAESTSLTDNR